MALTDQGTTFSHIFSILLTAALLFMFLFFTLLALRQFKSLAQKIKLLIATAVRKRRQMATYGVKPNPRYFVSQLQKQQRRQLDAEVQQKRESNFKIVLYYLYDIYNPVYCVFHRCIKRRKEKKLDQKRRNYLQRKMQESNRVKQEDQYDDDQMDEGFERGMGEHGSNMNIHSQQNLSQQAQIDLPARKSFNKLMNQKNYSSQKRESKLHRRKLEQLEDSNELIQVNFLRPSKWFYSLQYIGGLALTWFIILSILAILYISTSLVQTTAALVIAISIVSAFLSSFAIIGFYWYSHKIYRTSIRQTFEKTYLSTLIQPLSKPRPTTGATRQGVNQYAMMSEIMYDHNYQLKQANTMDAEMLRYKGQLRSGMKDDSVSNQKLRSLLASPPPQRAYSSGVVGLRGGLGSGLRTPISTERNGLIDKNNLQNNKIYQDEIQDQQDDDDEGFVKDGSGNNLLMNVSGNEQLLEKDQVVKSDMQDVFTKGEFSQIRRTSQEKNNKIADNILVYVMIGLMVLLVIGIQTILISYLSTAFAVSSLASFLIASILEIFLVRPFYIFLWTLIKRRCQKNKTQDQYDRIDDLKPPHENPAFMDQVNQQAAMRQFAEQEKRFQRDNQEEQVLDQQNKSGSGDGQDQDPIMDDKIIDDENQDLNRFEVQGKGQDGVDKLGQKVPEQVRDENEQAINAEIARGQNGDLIQLNSAQGQQKPDDQLASNGEIDKLRLKSPDPDLQRVDSEYKNQPQSPFGAGMSNIPRKATASFDRRGQDQDDDIDRVAHIIVSPNKNLRKSEIPKQDDEAQGFRSQSPQNLRRNQDGIPGRKVDTKNQSYIGPAGQGGDQEDFSSPVLIPSSSVGVAQPLDKDNKKKQSPDNQKNGKKDPKYQSGTKNRSPNSQLGGSFEGQDDDLNDRSGENPEKQRLENQAIGGSAVPFSNQMPVYLSNREMHPVDQGVGDDEPMHQLMNEYAQTDLPPYVAGRRSPDYAAQNRPVSRLSGLSPLGEFSRAASIPEQAQMSQMLMNPLDDLCPYKKVMTDIIYLSCGPEGGDQIIRKLKKKPGAEDISMDDLQKIIDQNNYEVDPDHEEEINNDDAQQSIQIKPGIKPVIPIDEHPAEDEITSSMPRSSVHGQSPPKLGDSRQEDPLFQQQDKKQQLTDSQLIENEMQLKQQEEQSNNKIPEERGVDVSFAVNQDQDENDPNQMFKVEAAEGEQAGIEGELQNLEDEFKPPLEDQVLPIEEVNKSKSSMRYQRTPSPQVEQGQDKSRKSPSPVSSQRKSGSRVSSTKKSPSVSRTPSPKRVLMGAGNAPNAKKPSTKGIRPKQKSFQLDMGDLSGTIIMSAESGGRTPPGIQASEGFFINGPDGSSDISPVGKNRSPLLHGKKKKKKSISPLRAKPDSHRKGPKARGVLASKPEDQNIEYDQGDHQDSQQIDPTIVYFKQGMGLPFDSQVSDQDYGDADIVYQKDDLTNYSKGLGINRVMNPGHLFGKKNKGKKFSRKPNHSMYSDRLSSLGAQSEDQARYYKRPILNRSFRSTGSIRPASLGLTPNHRSSPYDPYGQKRVDCWNHDYIMMSELQSKKPRKKKRFKKSPSYNYVQPHVYDHITSSKFFSGGQDDGGEAAALTFNNATMYRSGRKGKLPPLGGLGSSSTSRPKKNKRSNKKGSKETRGQAQLAPIDIIFPEPATNRSSSQILYCGQIRSLGHQLQKRNMGTRFTDMSSGFGRDPVMTASNLRGRQHERSMQQGSQVLQDEDYDGTSPYNQNLFRRFNQWEPLKESKQSKRKNYNQIKAEQLSKNYGGPLQVTGIATCGGVRPSQRRKWQKQHRLLELQRSHMFHDDYSINVQGSPLPNGSNNNNRLPSNRSSRSSLPPFPPQPQANFDPKTYKQYDSDSSTHQRRTNLNNSKLNRSGVVNNSSLSPIPRNQQSSVESNRGLPRLPQKGGVMNNSAMKKQKKKKKSSPGGKSTKRNYDPLFNPEQTDQKFIIETEHHDYDSHSIRSDNPVENMASPVNFGSPGVIHDDDQEEDEGMSDDVRFSSGIKQPTRQVNPVDLGLPPLPKQHTQDAMSDQAEIEDL